MHSVAFVSILFLYAVAAAAQTLPAGIINGDTIKLDGFARDVGRRMELNSLGGRQSEHALVEQAWASVLRRTVLRQQAAQRGITVREADIDSLMYTATPDFIKTSVVDEKGRFDKDLLRAIATNPDSVVRVRAKGKGTAADITREADFMRESVRELREKLRETLVEARLRDRMLPTFAVDTMPVYEMVVRAATRCTAEVAVLPCAKRAPVPSDEEIQAYYDDHTAEYTSKLPMRRLAVMAWPVTPTRQDSTATFLSIRSFIREMRTLKTIESKDSLWKRVANTTMQSYVRIRADSAALEPLWSALKNETRGTVVGPVFFNDSLRVMRLDSMDTRGRIAYVRMLSTTVQPSQQTVDSVLTDVQKATAAYDSGVQLGEVAEKFGRTLELSRYFTADEELFGSYRLADVAFQTQRTAACDPVDTPEKGIVLGIVADSLPAGPMPLEAVSDAIRKTLLARRACMLRQLEAKSVVSAATILHDGTMMIAEAPRDLKVFRNAAIEEEGYIGEDHYDMSAAREIRARKETGMYGPFLGDYGWYVVNVRSVTPPKPADLAAYVKARMPDLVTNERMKAYDAWLDDLIHQATVTDNRWMYFRY